MRKHLSDDLILDFPMIKLELGFKGIIMALHVLDEYPERMARLEAELRECGNKEDMNEILSDILYLQLTITEIEERITTIEKIIEPYLHCLN